MVAAQIVRLAPALPPMQARIDPTERGWTNTQWGDLKGATLQGIHNKAERGDVADYADLCEYAIKTDPTLRSLYDTRLDRVVQADWVVRPDPDAANPVLAELVAEFVNEQVTRIPYLDRALRELLHAIAIGYSASECIYEYDRLSRTNYIAKIMFVHPHRFRYDEQRVLRLYDRGSKRSKGSAYGELLDHRKWIVHQPSDVAGYGGFSGVMASCIWRWMFSRWVDRFWIGHQEKYGSPIAVAKVTPHTPQEVRAQILSDLQNLSNDHVAVFEGHELQLLEAATTNPEGYEKYQDYNNAAFAKAWLGASDIVDPGSHGSQSAVETRASVATDPRMVRDGSELAESLRYSLYKGLVSFNLHKFPAGLSLEQIPLPIMRLKTADDEVQRDPTARAQEIQDENAAPDAEAAPTRAPDPKAQAPEPPGQTVRTQRRTSSRRGSTRRTSWHSPSPFATTLRKGSGE